MKAAAAPSRVTLSTAATVVACLLLAALCAAPSLALVPNGDQGWYWQMPTPPGASADGLLDVTFATNTEAWAVGEAGVVLHSTDAGATWQVQRSGTAATLYDVSFVDGLHGWAVGADGSGNANPGVLTSTSDGGAHWQARVLGDGSSTQTASLDSVCFVDQAHGWIGTSTGVVLRTSDGGSTWTARPIRGYKDYLLVDFVDSTHGWALGGGGHAWRTCNGGRSWQAMRRGISKDSYFMVVDFWDRRHGWAMTIDEDWEQIQVLSTANGGISWKPIISTSRSWLTGLCMTGPSSGLVIGGDYYSLLSSYGLSSGYSGLASPITVRRTTDGGHAWTRSSFCTACSPTTIAAKGRSVCAVGSGIVTSSDGAEWTPRASGMQYSFVAGQALSTTDLWAVDSWGALLHSPDGVHWQPQPGFTRWSCPLASLSFADAQNGWVTGAKDTTSDEAGTVWHTTDGGGTWTEQEWPLSGDPVDIDSVDAATVWAVTSRTGWARLKADTTVAHTTDGGATWFPQWVPQCIGALCLDFVDASRGWVAGGYAKKVSEDEDETVSGLSRTINGGQSWSRCTLPDGVPYIRDLEFVDALNGWAVGTDYDRNEGWLLRTSDGGATWARVPGVVAPLSAVHFLDAAHGWAGGNGVYATTDGGATWSKVATVRGVTSLAAADPQHAWAFGDGILLGTVAASGDLSVPITADDGDQEWHRETVDITLTANDPDGAVARTEYSVDGGLTWQSGSRITFAAERDHSTDGENLFQYRSVDASGNAEPAEISGVYLDTLGPTCSVPRKAIVNSGEKGILYFNATDATSGVDRVTIAIKNRRGRILRSFTRERGNWGMYPDPDYLWLRFRCTLKPGKYRIEVRAVDAAGNRQKSIGRGLLKVRASGAPEVEPPHWPQGLPYESSTGLEAGTGRLSRVRHMAEQKLALPERVLDLLGTRLQALEPNVGTD